LLLVYSDAERAIALPVAQSPNAVTFPEILIVSSYVVVTVSSNVTSTEVAVVHELVEDALLVVVEDLMAVEVVVDEAFVVVAELPNPAG
jgi:hypothetical protein